MVETPGGLQNGQKLSNGGCEFSSVPRRVACTQENTTGRNKCSKALRLILYLPHDTSHATPPPFLDSSNDCPGPFRHPPLRPDHLAGRGPAGFDCAAHSRRHRQKIPPHTLVPRTDGALFHDPDHWRRLYLCARARRFLVAGNLGTFPQSLGSHRPLLSGRHARHSGPRTAAAHLSAQTRQMAVRPRDALLPRHQRLVRADRMGIGGMGGRRLNRFSGIAGRCLGCPVGHVPGPDRRHDGPARIGSLA